MIPFKGAIADIQACLDALIVPEGVRVVVIDDGNNLPASLHTRGMAILPHTRTRGPGAARNTGLQWCWQHGIQTVIFLDADCVPAADFVATHLAAHDKHPDAICIGGVIQGCGEGFWAYLDSLMSWFTSLESLPEHVVEFPLHLPSTNMSVKLLPAQRKVLVFDETFRTGEDVAFVNGLRAAGERIVFSPQPRIVHRDRTSFRGFFRHQYRWGLHTYVVRFGKGLSVWQRMLLATGFLPAIPIYAAYASWLTMRLWIESHPKDIALVPVVYLFYVIKGFAVLQGTLQPSLATYRHPN